MHSIIAAVRAAVSSAISAGVSQPLAKVRRRPPDASATKESRRSRLERWAELVNRDPHQIVGLVAPSWACAGETRPLMAIATALDIAWSDPVFRVTGLRSRSRQDAKGFFGLSDAELDRIISGSWQVPVRPAWQVAARITNVADPRCERTLLIGTMSAILIFLLLIIGVLRALR